MSDQHTKSVEQIILPDSVRKGFENWATHIFEFYRTKTFRAYARKVAYNIIIDQASIKLEELLAQNSDEDSGKLLDIIRAKKEGRTLAEAVIISLKNELNDIPKNAGEVRIRGFAAELLDTALNADLGPARFRDIAEYKELKSAKGYVKRIVLNEYVRRGVEFYIDWHTEKHRKFQPINVGKINPYLDYNKIMSSATGELMSLLDEYKDEEAEKLMAFFKARNEGRRLPEVILLKNGPSDPHDYILDAPFYKKTFNYIEDAEERGKKSFYSEIGTLIFAALLGYVPHIDPNEHKMKPEDPSKVFHAITPRKVHLGKRTGSTGGEYDLNWHTEFNQTHNFKTTEEIEKYIESINFDISKFLVHHGKQFNLINPSIKSIDEETIKNAKKKFLENFLSLKDKNVEGLILTGVVNQASPTDVLPASYLKEQLINKFSEEKFYKFARITQVAFTAGTLETGASGKIGLIAPVFELDEQGNIKKMRINMNINGDGGAKRMYYVGGKREEAALFEEFYNYIANEIKGIPLLIKGGEGISVFINDEIAAHGRSKLASIDRDIPLKERRLKQMRNLTRLYLNKVEQSEIGQFYKPFLDQWWLSRHAPYLGE